MLNGCRAETVVGRLGLRTVVQVRGSEVRESCGAIKEGLLAAEPRPAESLTG